MHGKINLIIRTKADRPAKKMIYRCVSRQSTNATDARTVECIVSLR